MSSNTRFTHDDLLKQIREWLDSTQMAHTVRPKDQTQEQFHFVIDLANPLGVSMFVNKQLPDRLTFVGRWNFHPTHKEAYKQLEAKKFNEVITNLTDKLTIYNVEWNFEMNGQEINSLSIFQFLYFDAIDKDRFFHTLARTNIVHFQVGRLIVFYVDLMDSSAFKTSETSSKSAPYS